MALKLPTGFAAAGVAAGIKSDGDLDLGIMVADGPVSWAGTFTRNGAAAPCISWCRNAEGGQVRGIVVNSGNANACTGSEGAQAVEATAVAAARALGCKPQEILVASTGPIGVRLPVDRLTDALPGAVGTLDGDGESFARSILTTDTQLKTSVATAGSATVVGIAKGAAMLAPNMATMLAFLVTDAAPPEDGLRPLLNRAVRLSFDRISVDACESTNDSVFLLSSARAGVDREALGRAVERVCADLAEQMVRDAEGGSKLVRIQVTGTKDDDDAAALGRAVAGSSLWRAAVTGEDPNWGRAIAALGAHDRSLSPSDISLAIGPEMLFENGQPCGSVDAARKAMSSDEFTLSCIVGMGAGAAEILSADLSTDYVELNAGGTT